eukprot:8921-Rhodomonas_salina.2
MRISRVPGYKAGFSEHSCSTCNLLAFYHRSCTLYNPHHDLMPGVPGYPGIAGSTRVPGYSG